MHRGILISEARMELFYDSLGQSEFGYIDFIHVGPVHDFSENLKGRNDNVGAVFPHSELHLLIDIRDDFQHPVARLDNIEA